MKEIATEVQINAPVDQVWQTLTDFEAWKDWNPTVKGVRGKATIGTTLTVTMGGKGGKEMSYQPKVVESHAPKRFRWRAVMGVGFLFTNDRIFVLEERAGGTHLTHTEAFSGLMAMMSWKKLSQFVPSVLGKMNEALKAKLETQSASGS